MKGDMNMKPSLFGIVLWAVWCGRLAVASEGDLTAVSEQVSDAVKPDFFRNAKILYQKDFEDGQGIHKNGGNYRTGGNWMSNFEKEARLSLDAPQGKGNDSKLALTCHTTAALPYVSCEVPLYAMNVYEPEGWDGWASFKIYNGGFKNFHAMCLHSVPDCLCKYRHSFEVPKGTWVAFNVPMDKFTFQGMRPRRGAKAQHFVIVAEEPEGDNAIFQIDDVKLLQVKRENFAGARPKTPLPEGVLYSQDFNDPHDFDYESYYLRVRHLKMYRICGGLDENGRPAPEANDGKESELGALKLECLEPGKQFFTERQLSFNGADTSIEFDCYPQGVTELAFGALSANGRFRSKALEVKPETWTHVNVKAAGMLQVKSFATALSPDAGEPTDTKAASSTQEFKAFAFIGRSGDKIPGYVLIDNLIFRRSPQMEGTQP